MAFLRNVLLLLPLLLVVFLIVQGIRGDREDPSLLLAKLRAETKAEVVDPLSGLHGREEVRAFTAGTLYDLVDGGADAYLKHGCRGAFSTMLTWETGEEVQVEAFEMGTPEGALGIWTDERGPGLEDRDVGEAGYGDAVSLRFRKGNYFVRLTSAPATERTPAILLEAGRAIAQRLP